MTLGMLSGGLSPNSAAAFNTMMGQSPRGTNYGNFDVGMATDSVVGTTALTPGIPLDPTNPFGSLNSMASPFSVFNVPNGQGMVDIGSNLDWEAWDSYVQNSGAGLDAGFQFYPPEQTQVDRDAQQQQQQGDKYTFGDSVFMGANTPGR
jgi:hypothetical protein